jgi:hypothetical protein
MNRYIKIGFVTSVVVFVCIYTKAVAAKYGYAVAPKAKYKYAAAPKSNKYHYPSCRWVQKFGSRNLEPFISAKDALAAGYIPCKVCKPPIEE